METLAIIDFETTGLSPQEGARAAEIAAVVLQDDRITCFPLSFYSEDTCIIC